MMARELRQTGPIGIYLVVLVLLVITQLLFSANFVIILIVSIGGLVPLFPPLISKRYDLGFALTASFFFVAIVFPAAVKTLLGQPIDSNLQAPVETYLSTFFCGIGLLTASILVSGLAPTARPTINVTPDSPQLHKLGVYSGIIGLLFWGLHRLSFTDLRGGGADDSGFGGFGNFQPLVFFSVTALTTHALLSSGLRKSTSVLSTFFILASVAMCLVNNDKRILLQAGTAYLLPCILIRKTISKQQILTIVGGAIFASAVLGPVVQVMRAMGVREMSLGDRFELVLTEAPKVLSGASTSDIQQALEQQESADASARYFGSYMPFVGRFASLQYVDPFVNAYDQRGKLGHWVVTDALRLTLPGFLRGSDSTPIQDRIAWAYGLKTYGIIAYPVVPMPACVLAADGWRGFFWAPIIGYFTLLLCIKVFCGTSIQRNIICMFIFSQLIISISSFSIFHIFSQAFRNLPILLIAILLINLAAKKRFRGHRASRDQFPRPRGKQARPNIQSNRTM